MKQKNKLATLGFVNNLFLSCAALLGLICLEGQVARANNAQIPGLSIARFALPTISTHTDPVNPTGTSVGAKVIELKKMLQDTETGSVTLTQSTRDLYEKAITEVNQYYLTAGEIEAKLQLGSTPANPKLIELRNTALQQLDQIAHTIGQMNGLISRFSNASQQVKVLTSQTQASLQIPGAVDEDHAHLLLISSELKQLDGAITQILNILTANTQRQGEWLNAERIRFASLSSAIDRGQLTIQAQGLAINTVFPRPESLPELKSSKKIHNIHKHSHPHAHVHESSNLIKAELESESSANKPLLKPTPKPLKLTPQASYKMEPQPFEKKEILSKTNSESPLAKTPTMAESKPLSEVSPAPLSLTPNAPDKAPLPKVTLEARPKIQSLPEKGVSSIGTEETKSPVHSQTQRESGTSDISYATAINNRSPLGLLEPNQDVQSQKWTLFSSAKRGIKKSTDVIEIVSIGDAGKGQDVKNTLIEMGLKPNQIKVISTKPEEGQSGKVFLFNQ